MRALSVLAAMLFGLGSACSTEAGLAGKGEACYRAEDCEEGLVCIKLACSDDVASLVSTLPPP